MNCIEFESAMESAVEAREPLSSAVSSAVFAHATTCAACVRTLELQKSLDVAIVAWRSTQPPAGLADAVLAELPESAVGLPTGTRRLDLEDDDCDNSSTTEFNRQFVTIEPVARRTIRSTRFALTAMLICLCLVALLIGRFEGKPMGPRFDELTEHPPNRSTMGVAVVQDPDTSSMISDVLSDLRSEYLGMASETTAVARDIVNVIPTHMTTSVFLDSDEIELFPNSRDLTRIWQPIGSRVESALGFLWQAVPGEGPAG